jgi:hypothetical protein
MSQNGGKRRVSRLVPHSWAASMEAESREWMVHCDLCGYEQSVWDLGGTRWKASGNSKQFRKCANCGERGWHTVYRQRAGAPPALPVEARAGGKARSRAGLWLALLAVIIGVVVVVAVIVFVGLIRDAGRARDTTNGYFAAVIAGNWAEAQADLSAAQRARDTPADLQAIWAARASAHGPATSYSAGNTSLRNGVARMGGTLRYRDGTSEQWTLQLVKEDGDWKITSSP